MNLIKQYQELDIKRDKIPELKDDVVKAAKAFIDLRRGSGYHSKYKKLEKAIEALEAFWESND